jgi:hypothetical protein
MNDADVTQVLTRVHGDPDALHCEEERLSIVEAIGGPVGRWFKCPNGHSSLSGIICPRDTL